MKDDHRGDKDDDDNYDDDDSVDNNIGDGKEKECSLSSLLIFRMLAEYI